MYFGTEYLEFVREHRDEDPAKLRLRFHKDERDWLPYAINNIAALKKTARFRLRDGADLTPPVIPLEVSAQQSTSADIALLHSNLAKDARTVLDMTFGLGMDARMLSLDPLRKITGFDLREELVAAAKVNFATSPNVEVFQGNSVEFLEKYNGEPFDLIFIDPARRGDRGERLFNLHDCQPDLIDLLPLLKRKSRRIMAKLSPMLDITQTLRDLPGTIELHIVEEGGECKELLAIIQQESTDPLISIDRFSKGKFMQFTYRQSEEEEAAAANKTGGTGNAVLGRIPNPWEYLLEPSAATMKAAPFHLLARRFGIKMLHPNTHIYISETNIEDFPGNAYMVTESGPLSSAALKWLGKSVDRAEIAVRNLKGFTAETLRKRLKIKEGGNMRLYAVSAATPYGTEPTLILTKNI